MHKAGEKEAGSKEDKICIRRWRKIGEYSVGSQINLSNDQVKLILSNLTRISTKSKNSLEGRAQTIELIVPQLGELVIKKYSRGGFLKNFISHHYLRFFTLRPFLEFQMLTRVKELGVNAPTPVAVISKGSFIYLAWLVLYRIHNKGTLVTISKNSILDARRYTEQLVHQLMNLIENKIYHIDLHPGNVIVCSKTDEPFILDFDKAKIYRGSKEKLKELYLRRWRRAVIKHNLPEILAEIMCLGLRSVSDQGKII